MTPTEDHKAILTRAASLFGPAQLDEYLKLYAVDSQLHFLPPGLPQGRPGARLFYQGVFAAFDDVRLTIRDMVGEGDRVAVRFGLEGTHRAEFLGVCPSGRRVTAEGITIFRFEAGECVERWSESNLIAVLQQSAAV
jgi:predicted ester cyclase